MSDTVDKDGFLYKRSGSTKKSAATQKKWKAYYFNLVQGSLYYYQNAEDPEPKGKLQLRDVKFSQEDPQTENSGKKFTFSFRNDKQDLLLAAEEEQEWKEWVDAINANLSKDPAPPLKKEKRKSRAQEIAFKMKKNLGTKAAISPLGKKAIRSQAPEEITNLVKALKHIVELESKSPKRASEMEENIYKLGIKAYFLIDGGKVNIDDLLVADKPLRAALELLAKCHDHAKYSRAPNEKLLREKFGEVQAKLFEGADILSKLMEPHLKPKTLKTLREIVEFIGNSDRLLKIFQDSSLDDDLQELISASEHYTQFHFYAEK
jgi:hypothetical protein